MMNMSGIGRQPLLQCPIWLIRWLHPADQCIHGQHSEERRPHAPKTRYDSMSFWNTSSQGGFHMVFTHSTSPWDDFRTHLQTPRSRVVTRSFTGRSRVAQRKDQGNVTFNVYIWFNPSQYVFHLYTSVALI